MTTETPKTADAAPNGAGGGSAAGTADLDGLLNEFTAKPDKTPTPDVLKQLAPVIDFAQTEMANRAKEGLNKDLAAAIGFVKEDEAAKAFPDKVVRGLLEVHAAEDPSFAKAFENRSKDQKAWQAKLAEARTAVAAELKTISPNGRVSSDVLAARAAISGSSSTPGDSKVDATALFAMSDQDYQRHLESEFAKARR
jgi:hypothetical protein